MPGVRGRPREDSPVVGVSPRATTPHRILDHERALLAMHIESNLVLLHRAGLAFDWGSTSDRPWRTVLRMPHAARLHSYGFGVREVVSMRTHLYVTPLVVVLCLCGAREAAAQGPEAIGEWGPLQASPVVAVHSSLLPSGKVLLWPQLDSLGHNGTEAYLWDPLVNSFQSAVNNSTELYCSGHASLADGRLLSIGGEVGFATGLRSTNIFDPASETWSQRALMNFGRWYPTATTLADGRVLATSGLIDLGNEASTPELYDVGRDDWTPLPAADQSLPLYPFMFVLPDAQIFYAGPGIVTRTLDLNTETWTEVGDSNVLGDSAAMYLPGKVLKSGGGDPPLDGADVIDMTEVSPEWRAVGPMAFARRSHNLVLLPDGKVLAVGGNSATRFFDDDPNDSVLEAELWDPSTGTWQTMAPIGDPRMYHSTAVLLPDGRVFVAGGNDFPTYQSYSPPYLFQGARPSLTAAPGSVLYGLTFYRLSLAHAAELGHPRLRPEPALCAAGRFHACLRWPRPRDHGTVGRECGAPGRLYVVPRK